MSPLFLVASVLAVGLANAGASQRDEIIISARPRRERREHEGADAKQPLPPKPATAQPRTLTEADNTRLREAAERRFRKAQRQARGIAQTTPPTPGDQSPQPPRREA